MSEELEGGFSALGEALEFIARHPRRDPAQRFSTNIADPRTSALLMEAAKGLRAGNLASAGRALLAAGGLLQALGGADMNAQTWNALFTTDPDRWAQRAGMLGLFDTQEDSVRACASLANHLAHCIRMEFEPPASAGSLLGSGPATMAMNPSKSMSVKIHAATLSLAKELAARDGKVFWDEGLALLSETRTNSPSSFWQLGFGACPGGLPAFPPMHFESELQSRFFAVGSQIEAIQIQEAAGQASTLATAKARSI